MNELKQYTIFGRKVKTYLLKLSQKYFRYEQLIVLGMLVIVAFLYYRDIFKYWFVADDALAIFSSTSSLKEMLFTRIYSSIFYTPLVPLSFKPDVVLFGITPLPYHIHNIMVLVLISFTVYKILRLYADSISSLFPAFIILLSTSSLVCLLWITLRQYLYAMFFSLLGVYIFLRYKPDLRNKPLLVLIILILSELSFMGKEQYMTLPFILFVLSADGFKQRVIRTYPYFILLAGHFLLRLHVLGGLGGYPGVSYNPVVYAKTAYESIFTESTALFGYGWFIIFLALPLLLRPKKLLTAILIWLASLLISFVVMYSYPQLDTYRYWLIATVLFSFMIGFNTNFIRSAPLKAIYCFMVAAFFLVHSLQTNKDIKAFFKKEALMGEQVAELTINSKYHDKLVLLPQSERNWLVTTNYIENISKAYYEVEGIKSSPPTFFPIELLSLYPETMKGKNVYDIEDGRVINITGFVKEKINLFNSMTSFEKPALKLFLKDNSVGMELGCNSAREIIGFDIRTANDRPFAKKYVAQYIKLINLTPFLNTNYAQTMPIEKLSYKNKRWYIGDSPIPDDTTFLTLMCVNAEGKHTRLSDIIAPK